MGSREATRKDGGMRQGELVSKCWLAPIGAIINSHTMMLTCTPLEMVSGSKVTVRVCTHSLHVCPKPTCNLCWAGDSAATQRLVLALGAGDWRTVLLRRKSVTVSVQLGSAPGRDSVSFI